MRKSKSKKVLSWLLILTMMFAMVTGCSSKKNSNKEEMNLSNGRSYSSKESGQPEYGLTPDSMDNGASISDGMEAKAVADFLEEEFSGQEFNNEEYKFVRENKLLSVKNNPISTFSIDVDTASYTNIRRMILNGQQIPEDAVRIEEMLNYFRYDYPRPDNGGPFYIYREASSCPWNENAKLLLIGLQGKDIDMSQRPASNFVFLLDVSGSMNDPDKLPLMQKAFLMLLENLNENDRISIVTYAGEERVVLEGARGNETMKISKAIEELSASGSTAGEAGIKRAYEIAREYYVEGGNNRVILATDGDLNVGVSSESELTRLIEEKRESGVFLSVLGFGTGNLKDNNLEALADNGNGSYSYIDSVLEAKKVLVEEMGGTLYTIAKDVKVQIEFNPAKIKGYRLIGYENRMLSTEDFEDDKKDAGEMGAGHRVTALYEIIETTSKQEIPETDLTYTESNDTNSDEWLTVKVRYKEPDGAESKLLTLPTDESIYRQEMSENLSFAGGVAAFGMLLKNSEYKGNASFEMVQTLLNQHKNSFDEYKEEFRYLVNRYSMENK